MLSEWTSTPPSEPGWYWALTEPGGDIADVRAVELLVYMGELQIYEVDGNDEFCCWPLPEKWQWWSTPLTPPVPPR